MRAVGGLGAIFTIASSIVNVIFATQIGDHPNLSALRYLLYIAFVISLVDIGALMFFCTFLVEKLDSQTLGSKERAWSLVAVGAASAAVTITVSGVALIWQATRQNDLPTHILQAAPTTLLGIWFATWAVASVLRITVYCLLHLWTRKVLTSLRASRLDMDFRDRAASVSTVARPATQRTDRSFGSQDLTLNSPPRTPVSLEESFTRRSSSTRVGPGSSRSRKARYSNRSSSDVVPFPAGETMSVDSAFDSWDTSSVHHGIRAAIHSSPPVTRGGLETIPGSRPESTELDGLIPQSPISSSPPHAATSDTATAVGWSSSPRQPKSSPPSSPINFSRPTSRQTSRPTSSHNHKPPPKIEAFDSSMQELIHPLFRPNSPCPPPVATMGTMITASPLANTLITPKTLTRLRSNSQLASAHWQTTLSIDKFQMHDDEQAVPDSPTLGSSDLGSPGPSIVDEAELPPILPGFVLSAGSRSSLVGYGKRKNVKEEKRESSGSMEQLN